jgi:hypothetical protein
MNALKKTILTVLLGTILMATQSFSQRGNRSYYNNNDCQNIPNLTEEQQKEIQELRTGHLKEMQQLRAKRRSTYNMDEKNQIRNQMLEKQSNHRKDIRSLLSEEQKTFFDANCQNRSGKNMQSNRSGRSGKGRAGLQNCRNNNW